MHLFLVHIPSITRCALRHDAFIYLHHHHHPPSPGARPGIRIPGCASGIALSVFGFNNLCEILLYFVRVKFTWWHYTNETDRLHLHALILPRIKEWNQRQSYNLQTTSTSRQYRLDTAILTKHWNIAGVNTELFVVLWRRDWVIHEVQPGLSLRQRRSTLVGPPTTITCMYSRAGQLM